MISFLYTLYITTGIFGLGITLIDMFGLIGDNDGAEVDGSGEGETCGDADVDIDVDVDIDLDTGSSDGSVQGSVVGHDYSPRGGKLLRFLSMIRNLIYFCLGFGPVGVAALLFRNNAVESLLWSGGFGIFTLLCARIFRRILKKDLNSIIKSQELLMEKGEVIVSIGAGQIGKVRFLFSGRYVERYARCKDIKVSIKKGEQIQVTETDDEYVYVEES